MSTLPKEAGAQSEKMLAVTERDRLSSVLQDEIEGVVWDRELPKPVAAELESWTLTDALPARFVAPSAGVAVRVSAILER